MATRTCPNCRGERSHVFHHVAAVPVNSCLAWQDMLWLLVTGAGVLLLVCAALSV
ncbi:MAG TPA: hypothetical protein VK577_16315 [Bradyrhizobium sp.]|nr:hypothetical protein [Bradyrhizobium sp.]